MAALQVDPENFAAIFLLGLEVDRLALPIQLAVLSFHFFHERWYNSWLLNLLPLIRSSSLVLLLGFSFEYNCIFMNYVHTPASPAEFLLSYYVWKKRKSPSSFLPPTPLFFFSFS